MKLKRQRQRFFFALLLERSVVMERIIGALPEWNRTMEAVEILELVTDLPPLSAIGGAIIRAQYSERGFAWPPSFTEKGFDVRDP
jgi:hypothetical protein